MLAGQSTGFVVPLLAAIAATAVITLVLTSIQQYYLLSVETRLALFGSARFFRRLLRLPVEFLMQRQPAEVAQRVSANDQVAQILTRTWRPRRSTWSWSSSTPWCSSATTRCSA